MAARRSRRPLKVNCDFLATRRTSSKPGVVIGLPAESLAEPVTTTVVVLPAASFAWTVWTLETVMASCWLGGPPGTSTVMLSPGVMLDVGAVNELLQHGRPTWLMSSSVRAVDSPPSVVVDVCTGEPGWLQVVVGVVPPGSATLTKSREGKAMTCGTKAPPPPPPPPPPAATADGAIEAAAEVAASAATATEVAIMRPRRGDDAKSDMTELRCEGDDLVIEAAAAGRRGAPDAVRHLEVASTAVLDVVCAENAGVHRADRVYAYVHSCHTCRGVAEPDEPRSPNGHGGTQPCHAGRVRPSTKWACLTSRQGHPRRCGRGPSGSGLGT